MPLKIETAKGAKKAEGEFLEIMKIENSCRSEASGTIDWMKLRYSRRMLRCYRIAPRTKIINREETRNNAKKMKSIFTNLK